MGMSVYGKTLQDPWHQRRAQRPYFTDHCEYEDQCHDDMDHKYAPQEFEQGHRMAEHEVQELKELIYDKAKTRMDWEGEQEGGDEVYEHREPPQHAFEIDKVHKCKQLKCHQAGMDNEAYQPQGPRYNSDKALKL